MEAQEVKDSRRDLQTTLEAMSQQNVVLQRLERNLRRLEDSYAKLASRIDAVEATRAAVEPVAPLERVRLGRLVVKPAEHAKEGRQESASAAADNADPQPGRLPEHPGEASAVDPQLTLVARAKSVLRGAILDGSVSTTLDKVQSSLRSADEAAGAISQISALTKVSLEGGAGTRQAGTLPIPGASLPLLLELAKTPQFQKFVANILAQFLKDMEQTEAQSPDASASQARGASFERGEP